jgi:polysaccharide export outer membrane protein
MKPVSPSPTGPGASIRACWGGARIVSRAILVGLLCLGVWGCAPKPLPPRGELPEPPVDLEMVLRPGDVIELDFVYWPELDSTQTIRPDGKIVVGELGYVLAAGVTPEQLSDFLQNAYGAILKDPVINVIPLSRAMRQIYVGGEVRAPGLLTLIPMAHHTATPGSGFAIGSGRVLQSERITLTQAIMAAGGFVNESASLSNVVVIRTIDDERHVAAFDLRGSLYDLAAAPPVILAAGDIVFVPRTKIDRLDQWIDQHINQIIPDTDLTWTFTRITSGGSRVKTFGVSP